MSLRALAPSISAPAAADDASQARGMSAATVASRRICAALPASCAALTSSACAATTSSGGTIAAASALPDGVRFEAVESFHTHPLLVDAFAEKISAAQPKPDELVIFTAHSLPQRVIAAGDRYADEVAATARGVAERAGIAKYDRAYQSAGRTPEPWIGPSLEQLIDDRSATTRKFLVVPIGFVCDHTEILFDIDIQAARVAREFSTTLRRTESLNTSPTFIAMLEDLVRTRL